MSSQPDGNPFPLAYLITFRSYGSWMHGEERGGVAAHEGNPLFEVLNTVTYAETHVAGTRFQIDNQGRLS